MHAVIKSCDIEKDKGAIIWDKFWFNSYYNKQIICDNGLLISKVFRIFIIIFL